MSAPTSMVLSSKILTLYLGGELNTTTWKNSMYFLGECIYVYIYIYIYIYQKVITRNVL